MSYLQSQLIYTLQVAVHVFGIIVDSNLPLAPQEYFPLLP